MQRGPRLEQKQSKTKTANVEYGEVISLWYFELGDSEKFTGTLRLGGLSHVVIITVSY